MKLGCCLLIYCRLIIYSFLHPFPLLPPAMVFLIACLLCPGRLLRPACLCTRKTVHLFQDFGRDSPHWKGLMPPSLNCHHTPPSPALLDTLHSAAPTTHPFARSTTLSFPEFHGHPHEWWKEVLRRLDAAVAVAATGSTQQ